MITINLNALYPKNNSLLFGGTTEKYYVKLS